MKRIYSVLVENRSGVLSHISGLFSARGFNISSLAVGETEDPTMSRMTIIVEGDERTLEQVKKQLNRLIDVIKVQDLTEDEYFDRELLLLRVLVKEESKKEWQGIVKEFGLSVLYEEPGQAVVEVSGSTPQVSSLLERLKRLGLTEVVRTGVIAISKK